MRLRKLWLLILASYSLVACGPKGPIITDCISDPANKDMRCYDYQAGKNLVKMLKQVDGWICLSPVDEKNLLMACAGKSNGPQVNLCIFDYESDQLDCFNQISSQANHIPYEQSANYICVSAFDYQSILTYCAQKKAGIIP